MNLRSSFDDGAQINNAESDSQVKATDPREFTSRILLVWETVAKQGPIDAIGLENLLSIPRVSIWRALKVLVRADWLRVSLQGHLYEATSRLNDVCSAAHFALPETETLDEFVKVLDRKETFRVSAGILHGKGDFTFFEPVGLQATPPEESSLVYGLGARAAQIACTREELARHISLMLSSGRASADERWQIESGNHYRMLLKYVDQGYVLSEDQSAAAIPVRFSPGVPGMIEIGARKPSGKCRERLLCFIKRLQPFLIGNHTFSELGLPSCAQAIARHDENHVDFTILDFLVPGAATWLAHYISIEEKAASSSCPMPNHWLPQR